MAAADQRGGPHVTHRQPPQGAPELVRPKQFSAPCKSTCERPRYRFAASPLKFDESSKVTRISPCFGGSLVGASIAPRLKRCSACANNLRPSKSTCIGGMGFALHPRIPLRRRAGHSSGGFVFGPLGSRRQFLPPERRSTAHDWRDPALSCKTPRRRSPWQARDARGGPPRERAASFLFGPGMACRSRRAGKRPRGATASSSRPRPGDGR